MYQLSCIELLRIHKFSRHNRVLLLVYITERERARSLLQCLSQKQLYGVSGDQASSVGIPDNTTQDLASE